MTPLQHQLDKLQDLKIQRDRSAYRYYNRENQTILLNLIIHELKGINKQHLSKELYFELSNPERLATKDIEELCHIFKQIVIENIKGRN